MKKIFLVVGMAGSGKTTFCTKLYNWLSQDNIEIDPITGLNKKVYSINLDPAVINTLIPLNLDIREKINYDELMQKQNLGPNGAIITAINLFLLNINAYLNEIDSQYIIIDTPGQIEAFIWSSGGLVLVDSLKKLGYDLNLLFVMDSRESKRHTVFISNMLFAASLHSRYDIKTYCIFNKIDLVDTSEIEWMKDSDNFRKDLPEEDARTPMLSSLSLHFEEFYKDMTTFCISSVTSQGKKEFLDYFK
ncbi:ATP binding protein [Spraguea lophii 42_110]|uniref:GPN-loop GTPase n=1 Tax=Spraguea lophii (strain 42_110) TaxID=1358809 RepID=S7XS96_SPRLO|nr:ATP binding protein [Spraguea lophii 42_110]